MRLNLIATLLFSLSGLAMAGLQAHQHFLFPAIAPSMYDIGTLFGVLILAPEKAYQWGPIKLPALGLGIYGLVYGVIIGAALFLVIQIPALIHFRFRWSPQIRLKDPGVRKVLRLMGPRVLTVFFIQIIFITQDNLASRLPTGAITALVYGWLFMQVPETLIGTALGTALLPTLSEQISRNDPGPFQRTLEKSIRVILGLTVPLTAILAINLPPVVEILDFGSAGSNLIVWTSRAYLLGLLGHALLEVAARAFYAQQNAKIPLIASGLTWAAFLGLGIPLSLWIGAPGIGLANTLAFSAEALFLLILLYRSIPRNPHLKSTLLRVLLATALGSAVSLAGQELIPPDAFSTFARLVITAGVTLLSVGFALPFILPEIKELLDI
jgi:putative peptidoglycan lipid II flippase